MNLFLILLISFSSRKIELLILLGPDKKVKDLIVGDIVSTTNNEPTAIVSIVKNRCRNGFTKFIRIDDSILTPGHPVKLNGKWMRPEELLASSLTNNVKEVKMKVDEVYNFVVEKRSSLYLNKIEVSTLGQFCEGIDEENSYFGSERVIDYLKSQKSYPHITLYSNSR